MALGNNIFIANYYYIVLDLHYELKSGEPTWGLREFKNCYKLGVVFCGDPKT